MLVLHQLEDFGNGHTFRHHVDFPHNGPEVEPGLFVVRIHELPDVDHPQDMVPILFTERIPGVAGFPDHLHVLLDGIVHEQAHHVLPGHHHFPGHPVCKVEHVVDEPAFHRIDAASLFAGADHLPDVVFRMAGAGRLGFHPHEPVQGCPQVPEHKSKRI